MRAHKKGREHKKVPAVKIGSLDEGVLLHPTSIGLTVHEDIVKAL